MLKQTLVAIGLAAALGVAACGPGGAEKAGENADSAIEEATQGEENLSDGALEKAGESVDQATGGAREQDLGDTVNDATDGKASTTP
jgi:hypothetical protein